METHKTCCTPSRENPAQPPAPSQHSEPGTAAPQRPSIHLPGGTFLMGTNYAKGFPSDGEGPVRRVTLSPFAIDTYPVTNSDYAQFIEATAYVTDAERFGWSFVFWSQIPEDRFAATVEDTVAVTPWWCKVPGASWKHPAGPGSTISERLNHPAVHISWNDAHAYAHWASAALPSEAQWEYAARGGLEQQLYPWGDELTPNGRHLCNIWQGKFPMEDTAKDGYAGPCPVDAFPPNAYGLYSITGNVWEWCHDWFSTTHTTSGPDPAGPAVGEAKVMKGGSFLCHASYCNRYRVAARTANTPDSSSSNIGFRCVRMA